MAGALATMVLADCGAEVIRVEPLAPDPLWEQPAYLLWHRGKKSVQVDLGSDVGGVWLRRMVASSDVLIESLRPGAAERLGLDWPALRAVNSQIVCCSISAFGRRGPYRNLKATDGVVNAKTGRMRDQTGHQGDRPTYRAIHDTSFHTAMFSLQGILAALRVVWLTGVGQLVETSLLSGTTAPYDPWLRLEGAGPDGATRPARMETDPETAPPSLLCTRCQDGRWIMHCHPQRNLFRAWISAIGLGRIWDDPRYQDAPVAFADDEDRVVLNRMIMARMAEKSAAEWIDVYREHPDCAGEIVQTVQEALAHELSVRNHYRVELEDPRVGTVAQVGALVAMSETPAEITRPAPIPGQHTWQEVASPPRARRRNLRSSVAVRHALDGITVVELASWLATPFGAALLAELGARVIKVEPLVGDPHRAPGTNENNRIRANQGKESLAVDLKMAEGRRILARLLGNADVLIHNLRPGAAARVGIDYESVHRLKPDIVYLYATAYGSTGRDSARAAFNPTVAAFAGTVALQSGEGNLPIADPSADPVAGSAVATAALLGLVARLRTGKGQYLETSMINSALYCNSADALDYVGKPPCRDPDRLQLGIEATYRLYETRDGWVFLAAPSDKEFRKFCLAAEVEELGSDERFSTWSRRYEARMELGALLGQVFLQRTADDWENRLLAQDVSCVRADGPGYRTFLHEDRHTQAIGFMIRTAHKSFADRAQDGVYWRHRPAITFSATPSPVGQAYEDLGEHTDAILREQGYSVEDIDRFETEGVIRRGPPSRDGSSE
jgi:crotonobetainyl-CoA:carnitine CoA-transferase CaiB-like acyl-CoA transferase